MNLSDQIDQHLMQLTNLSRNQMRAWFGSAGKVEDTKSVRTEPETAATLFAPKGVDMKVIHQELPIIQRGLQVASAIPGGGTAPGVMISGFTVLVVDPSDSSIKMYENCSFTAQLGDEVT